MTRRWISGLICGPETERGLISKVQRECAKRRIRLAYLTDTYVPGLGIDDKIIRGFCERGIRDVVYLCTSRMTSSCHQEIGIGRAKGKRLFYLVEDGFKLSSVIKHENIEHIGFTRRSIREAAVKLARRIRDAHEDHSTRNLWFRKLAVFLLAAATFASMVVLKPSLEVVATLVVGGAVDAVETLLYSLKS